MRALLIAGIVMLVAGPVRAASAWDDWAHRSDQQCPSKHVQWICNDCMFSLTEAFERTLTNAQMRRVSVLADDRRRCATTWGFFCQTKGSLDAYERLGLMTSFVRSGCRTVKCEEVAECSRYPPGP